jgi:hypothetical protein
LDCKRPRPIRGDGEDAAEGNVDDVEIALCVEGRTFDEAIDRLPAPVGVSPLGADAAPAKMFGHRREHACPDQSWRRFQILHFLD